MTGNFDPKALTNAELLQAREALAADYDTLFQDFQSKTKPVLDELRAIGDVLAERAVPHVEVAYKAKGAESGKVTVTVEPGFQVEANITKKVKWDQDKLKAIAATLPWAQVAQLFKIEFSVPEKQFAGLLVGTELRDKVEAARTVEYGAPVLKLNGATL